MRTRTIASTLTIISLAPLMAAPHAGSRVREVNMRRDNEQQRIDRAFADGELTSGQDKSLETREAHIKKVEQRDMHKDDGHLTKTEFGQLKRDEDHVSRTIRRDKKD